MGAKAKQPARTRRSKHPAAKQSAKVSARKRHHFYPDSVPPAMAHEVFDVSRIDEDGLEVLDDDEVELEAPAPATARGRARSEAPHPPRPSVRPRPLAPDDVRVEPTLSYASNPAAVLIDVPVSQPPRSSRTSVWTRTAVLMLSAALLALIAGAVLARHGGPRARPAADSSR